MLVILAGLAYAGKFDQSLSALAMGIANPVDSARDVASALDQQEFSSFLSFMDRSLFEGEAFGAGDIPIILQIAALLLYGTSFARRAPKRLKDLRPGLAYIWVSALATAALVHLFKGIIARPRPYEVAQGLSSFHMWYDLHMPRFFAFAKGSFPSGHTAGAATLWSLVLVFGWLYPKGRLALGLLAGISTIFCLSMGFSRVAHGDHWPTDTLAAIVLAFFVATMLSKMMLASPKAAASTAQRTAGVLLDVAILFWCCGVWLTIGALYLALKLFANGDLILGAAALLAFLGGVYGTSLARVRGLRS